MKLNLLLHLNHFTGTDSDCITSDRKVMFQCFSCFNLTKNDTMAAYRGNISERLEWLAVLFLV